MPSAVPWLSRGSPSGRGWTQWAAPFSPVEGGLRKSSSSRDAIRALEVGRPPPSSAQSPHVRHLADK